MLAHDQKLVRNGGIVSGAASGVAAFIAVHGITNLIIANGTR